MTLNEFVDCFAAELDETPKELFNAETVYRDLDEWDSLTNLSLMAMVDSDYNVKLNSDEVTNSDTLLDLFNLIKSKQ